MSSCANKVRSVALSSTDSGAGADSCGAGPIDVVSTSCGTGPVSLMSADSMSLSEMIWTVAVCVVDDEISDVAEPEAIGESANAFTRAAALGACDGLTAGREAVVTAAAAALVAAAFMARTAEVLADCDAATLIARTEDVDAVGAAFATGGGADMTGAADTTGAGSATGAADTIGGSTSNARISMSPDGGAAGFAAGI